MSLEIISDEQKDFATLAQLRTNFGRNIFYEEINACRKIFRSIVGLFM